MPNKTDGGAAFPRAPFEVNDYCGDGSPGMSLRDYFIAHAPTKPTFDFDIRMSTPAPTLIEKKLTWFQRFCNAISMGLDFDRQYKNWNEYQEWVTERDNQRMIQWPGAWADAMLAEREKGGVMNWEDKCRDLERLYDRLRSKNEDLKDDISKLRRDLERAESRVHELEPLERARDAAYDQHVANGGTDICFRTGMSGNCGPECEAYGSKPECEAEPERTPNHA